MSDVRNAASRFSSYGEDRGEEGAGGSEGESAREMEALRQNEEKYARFFELVSDALFLIDKETGSILEVNAAAEALYGYSREELLRKRNTDLSAEPGETSRATREERQHIPYRLHRKKDGTVFPVEITASHFNWAGRQVHLAAIRDITDRKRVEDALRESEEKFRLTFHTSPDSINLNRLSDGMFLDINEGFTQLTGYTREDVIGRTSLDLNIWNDPRDRERLTQGLMSEGVVKNFEAEFRTKDGRIGTGLMSARILRIGQEAFTLSITREITERKLMEKQLHESEEKLRLFIEHAPAAIAMFDCDMRYVFASRRWLSDFRLTDKEVIGRVHFEVLPQTRERWEPICRSCLYGASWRCDEDTIMREDGTLEWIRWESRPWTSNDGLVGGIVIMSELITDRKQAEEQREKLQEQLLQAQKMESVGRLAGGVAHDFNNMLGVILGHAELSLDLTDAEDPRFYHISEIHKAAGRSAELTRQLLAFARRQTVSPRVLDLNDTVAGLLKMLRRLIGENIELVWVPGRELWSVKIDPSQIDQILVNLVVNAHDAISGMGRITIETVNAEVHDLSLLDDPEFIPGDYVVMSVSDNGAGMNRDVLDHIFEPFFTTKEVGRGTGLGLATVYGIVRQNAGFVKVFSEPGQGTVFRIYLPRSSGELSKALPKAASKLLPRGRETLLVVEDDDAMLSMMKAILLQLGYNPLTAGRPHEALQLARDHVGDIHLIITDVVMPEMNGRRLVEHLMSVRPHMKCLYMSGYTADVIAHHGIIDKGVSFIRKPFSLSEIAFKIRETLDEPPSNEPLFKPVLDQGT